MRKEWQKAFKAAFNTSAKGFDWNDVLKWETPDVPCPEGAHPTVASCALPMLIPNYSLQACGLVKSFEKRGLPNAYYCAFQYKNASICRQDPLCEYEAAIDRCNLREPTLDETGPITDVHPIVFATRGYMTTFRMCFLTFKRILTGTSSERH